MSLIPHSFMPRSMFNMDSWLTPSQFGHSTLDMFDPFDQLDNLMSRNMMWLNKPDIIQNMLQPILPSVPHKWRITLDVAGYNPDSIKTEFKDGKIIIYACEGVKHEAGGDYSIKEFKKTYKLPENAEVEKLASFVTDTGKLVVEVPLKEVSHAGDVFPRILDNKDGTKSVAMDVSLPYNINPDKIHCVCKDRDFIIKAEDKTVKPDGVSSVYYYKRTTLPENTDFDRLKCNYDNHKLTLEAPVLTQFKSLPHKALPIHLTKHHQVEGQQQQQAIKH